MGILLVNIQVRVCTIRELRIQALKWLTVTVLAVNHRLNQLLYQRALVRLRHGKLLVMNLLGLTGSASQIEDLALRQWFTGLLRQQDMQRDRSYPLPQDRIMVLKDHVLIAISVHWLPPGHIPDTDAKLLPGLCQRHASVNLCEKASLEGFPPPVPCR
jgi:hypothetical protein